MKRFHVHVNVTDLEASIGFYSTLSGKRLVAADAVAFAEKGTTCCYAHSDKYWAEDPQGVRWETFHTHGEATTYSTPAAVPSARDVMLRTPASGKYAA